MFTPTGRAVNIAGILYPGRMIAMNISCVVVHGWSWGDLWTAPGRRLLGRLHWSHIWKTCKYPVHQTSTCEKKTPHFSCDMYILSTLCFILLTWNKPKPDITRLETGCSRPSIVLQVQNRGLKQHSFHLLFIVNHILQHYPNKRTGKLKPFSPVSTEIIALFCFFTVPRPVHKCNIVRNRRTLSSLWVWDRGPGVL